ncbi:MAG TPA: NapC/NirT family cytochrome c [Gemmatimonadaceae bacterium]
MTDEQKQPGRFRRFAGRILPVGILVVILVSVATIGMVEFSSSPTFCQTCHNMKPYYESWKQSSHNDVSCIECHIAPGIKGEAMGKLQAMNQLVKYVTRTYGLKPWAEVEDVSCMRSGCHSERKVEGLVDFNGVTFDHTEHLGELRRDKQLRCTSCHSQIVQGEHIAVTVSTCILCHFKDRATDDPVAGCVGCHPSPRRVVSAQGFVVEHEQYVKDQISCVSCHDNVVTGSGDADPAMCQNCHNEPERFNRYDEVERMHVVHITDNKVECQQCHTSIEHKVVQLEANFELACNTCHDKAHEAQRKLYAGLGGHGTPQEPSKMFLARVSCEGCHEKSARLAAHANVKVAGEASCMSCHGIRYANMLPSWKRGMDERVGKVAPVIAQARAALNAAGTRQRLVADSLLRLAEENLELVTVGKSAHNVTYADQLLRASLDLVRQAATEGRLPYTVPRVDLGPPLSEGECLSCHLGVERASVPFGGGGRFGHDAHVVGARMACTDCHTPIDDHGGTTVKTREECSECHHGTTRACESCHRGYRRPP